MDRISVRACAGVALGALVAATAWTGCQTGSVLPLTPPTLTISRTRVGCNIYSRTARLKAISSEPGVTFRWFFPDGVAPFGEDVVHTFDDTGAYQVQLVATRADGSTFSTHTTVDIPVGGTADSAPNPFGDRCVADEGNTHVAVGTTVNYRAHPPASGNHYSQAGVAPISPGFKDTTVQPEVWVHNLEHGYVVFLYDCPGDCPPETLDQLRNLFAAAPANQFGIKQIVITRFPGLSVPFMAVSWDAQHDFATFDQPGMIAFYLRNVDCSPEAEEI
ncbi:MAG: DUF3105 domain-containing protein [Phycisphaerae bacterium]